MLNKIKGFLTKDKRIIPGILSILIIAILSVQIYMLSLFTPPEENLPEETGTFTEFVPPVPIPPAETHPISTEFPETPPAETAMTTPPVTAPAVASDGVEAILIAGDAWENDGRTATRISMEVRNNSSEAITSWTVTVDVPIGAEISGSWNGDFSINGDKLTISSTIERTLQPGESFPDAGFILLTDEPFMP